MAPRPKSPKLVAVHWLDAAGDRDDDKVAPANAITFGFITSEETNFIRVASEIFEDGTYREITAIPRGMIVAIIGKTIKLPAVFKSWKSRGG